MARNSVALGRPWHPVADPRADGSAVFVAAGWTTTSAPRGGSACRARQPTGIRHRYEPEGARFFEYATMDGPRRREEPPPPPPHHCRAAYYTIAKAVGDWTPGTR